MNQVTIIVNFNDDNIEVWKGNDLQYKFDKVKNLYKFQEILYEIINTIEPKNLSLESINEEVKRTLWEG